MIDYDERESCNFHYVIVEVDEERAGISRDSLVQALQAENVIARRYFFPGCHRMAPYSTLYPDAGRWLPRTERLLTRILSLPNGTALSAESAGRVAQLIERIVGNGAAVQAAAEGKGAAK